MELTGIGIDFGHIFSMFEPESQMEEANVAVVLMEDDILDQSYQAYSPLINIRFKDNYIDNEKWDLKIKVDIVEVIISDIIEKDSVR